MVAAGIAWAAATDNMVPTANYSPLCVDDTPDGPGGNCRTDNAQLSWYADSTDGNPNDDKLEMDDFYVVASVMGDEYEPTDLTVAYDSTPAFSGDSETDIVYQEWTVPGSADGVTWCNDAVGGFTCDQQYIRIERGGYYTPGITCHETGHAVGLVHGNNASPALSQTASALNCMKTPTSFGERLGTNNKENINNTY